MRILKDSASLLSVLAALAAVTAVLFCALPLQAAEKPGRDAAENKTAPPASASVEKHEPGITLFDKDGFKLDMTGVFELEAAYDHTVRKPGRDERSTDAGFATAQIEFAAKYEHVKGKFVFLWEEDGTDYVDLDEGTILYEKGNWFFGGGKTCLPFGSFESNFISDPLTLEFAEAAETVLVFGYSLKKDDDEETFNLTFMLFNGDTGKVGDGDEQLDKFSAGLKYLPADGLTFMLSFVSDVTDADGEMASLVDDGTLAAPYSAATPGTAFFAMYEKDGFTFTGELVAAARFDKSDLDQDGDGKGDKPFAFNFEAAFEIPGDLMTVAVKFEGTSELALPSRQAGFCAILNLGENSTLAAEYMYGGFDEDFSGDVKRHHLGTIRFAMEF